MKKNQLKAALAGIIILAAATALDLWVVNVKVAIHLYFWVGFIDLLIIGSFVVSPIEKKSEKTNQRFLTFTAGLVSLMFLAFVLSGLNIFRGSGLDVLRWSLLPAALVLYGLTSFEISECADNVARRRAQKNEWRFVINNTLIVVVIFSIFTQRLLAGLTVPNPTLNYYFTGFIIFMAISHILIWYSGSKTSLFSLGVLTAITLTLIAVFILSAMEYLEKSMPTLNDQNMITIASGVSSLILIVTVGYRLFVDFNEIKELNS